MNNVEQQKLKKMKIISKTIKLLPLFLMALVITSCSDDDDYGGAPIPPPELNIVQLAVATDDLSSLVAALQAADGDLVTVLSGSGPFTVLAPTNAAFATFLSDNSFASLDDVPTDVLNQVLLNHVISGDVSSTDLVGLGSGYTRTNATGAGGNTMSLYFDTSDGVVFNNVSTVETPDVVASNGTIHIVDAVIGLPSIVDHALNNPNFSALANALVLEDLVTTLQGDGPFTVLAPTNAAFSDFTNPNSNTLSSILLNHVLSGAITSADLAALGNTYANTLATGPNDSALSLYSNIDDGVRFNGVSSVAIADVIGTNGIIHAVDGVIDLPTIVTFALANPNLSSLVASLAEADGSAADPMLIPTLSGDGPFTVFAPLNSAFTTLLDSNPAWTTPADIDDALLNSVLTHHVLNGNNRAESLTDGMMVSTLEGDMITINLPGNDGNAGKITDGSGNTDIDIVLTNVQAINGVVHAVETVLIPDTTN